MTPGAAGCPSVDVLRSSEGQQDRSERAVVSHSRHARMKNEAQRQ